MHFRSPDICFVDFTRSRIPFRGSNVRNASQAIRIQRKRSLQIHVSAIYCGIVCVAVRLGNNFISARSRSNLFVAQGQRCRINMSTCNIRNMREGSHKCRWSVGCGVWCTVVVPCRCNVLIERGSLFGQFTVICHSKGIEHILKRSVSRPEWLHTCTEHRLTVQAVESKAVSIYAPSPVGRSENKRGWRSTTNQEFTRIQISWSGILPEKQEYILQHWI